MIGDIYWKDGTDNVIHNKNEDEVGKEDATIELGIDETRGVIGRSIYVLGQIPHMVIGSWNK